MKTKNILYIGNDLSKHTSYVTAMDVLSEALTKQGFQVEKSSDELSKFKRFYKMICSVGKYRNSIDYVLIDVFSTSYFYIVFVISMLCNFFGLKYITILHGGDLPARIEKSKKFSKRIFKNSFRNIAPSNYLKQAFERQGYLTDFIPNILKIENYEFIERKNPEPKILWVRAFRELYNPSMAIEVLNLVKIKYPETVLCMVGPEKDSSIDKVKELVHKYDLKESVEFTGVLHNKEWVKKSKDFDIFINTTNFDNTPVSVMEAMALGLFVVSTNAGGMPFLIDNGQEGVLVEKNDARSMADAIVSIIENKPMDLCNNARKKAESFSAENVMKQWNAILS
ncbi:glycosyltransferase family 4 protein [Flavicella marina]|uniref:glycosyltransferase family 4 protein n=1 Tax=Flavicella marina TaxID=1475951 RepID=UPI001264F62D|nr:glycosyltransferase family 4 protein [Flavicella marina]